MERIEHAVTRTARWLFVVRLIPAVLWALIAATALMFIARVVSHLLGVAIDWQVTWLATLGGAVLSAAAVVLITRPDRFAVARTIDERADLREAMSTAIWLQSRPDSAKEEDWNRAAMHRAEEAAGRVHPRALIPVVVPRFWYAPALLAGLFFVVGLFPSPGLLDRQGEVAHADNDAEIEQVKNALDDARQELKDALTGNPEAQDLLDKLSPDALSSLNDPEAMRSEIAKRMTEAKDTLEKIARSEDAAAIDEMKRRLAAMKGAKDESGAMAEFSKALRSGDFKAASEALEKLRAQLESGDLSQAERDALAEQLNSIAEQLERAAEDNRALAQALQQAGLNPNLASNTQQAMQAIQNSQNLTQQQKQQLQQMAQSQQSAQQKLNQAAGQCRNCAGGMKAGQSGQSGQSGQQGGQQSAASQMASLSQQLSQLGQMQQQIASARAGANSLQQQLQSGAACNNPGAGSGQGSPFANMFASGGGAGKPSPLQGLRQKHQTPGTTAVTSAQQGGTSGGQGGGGAGGTGAGSTGGAGLQNDATDPTQVNLNPSLASTINTGQYIVGTEFVDAPGLMTAEAQQAVRRIATERLAQRSDAQSASTNETVHAAEYHDAIRLFFEQLSGGAPAPADEGASDDGDAG